MGHARLSPSAADRWMICPASPSREAGYPDTGSEAAKLGTNGHYLLECLIETGQDHGSNEALPYPEAGLTPEIVDQAYSCYKWLTDHVNSLRMFGPVAVLAESKALLGRITGRDDGDGTADITIVTDSMLQVVDFKTGSKRVEADASQLKIYAAGKLAEYMRDDPEAPWPFSTIRLTVFQKRAPGKTETPRHFDMTPEHLYNWVLHTYLPAARATDDPSAKANPHPDACHFCKAKNDCEERKQIAEEGVNALFKSLGANNMATDEEMLLSASISDMSTEQLKSFLEAAPILKARIKEAEERAYDDLINKRVTPEQVGFKLVHGRSTRAWQCDEEEMVKKLKGRKFTNDEIYIKKLRTPKQMQDLGLDVKKWESANKLVVTKEGNLVLAPLSDTREDAMSATNMFEPVTNEPQEDQGAAMPDFLHL